jgi:hypothetical protein
MRFGYGGAIQVPYHHTGKKYPFNVADMIIFGHRVPTFKFITN